MVIGNGLIGRAFSEYQDSSRYLLFCSGVSNSTSKDPAEYDRERGMLESAIATHPQMHLVYFSTCSIEDPSMQESMYVAHKRQLEEYIAAHCRSFSIFRLSNVVGNTPNAFTVLNFLVNAVRSGERFRLWTRSTRNLIDIDDVVVIVRGALEAGLASNRILNIANPDSYPVPQIVDAIETFFQRKGNYEPVDFGADFSIDTSPIRQQIDALRPGFGLGYLGRLLHKYYQP